MKKLIEQFKAVLTAVGITTVSASKDDKEIHLSEEDATKLFEAAQVGQDSVAKIEELKNALTTATGKITALEADAVVSTEKIAALQNEVQELGKQPGVKGEDPEGPETDIVAGNGEPKTLEEFLSRKDPKRTAILKENGII